MSSVKFGSYPVSNALSSKRNSAHHQTSEKPSNANRFEADYIEQSFQKAEGNELVKLDNIEIQFNGQQNGDQQCSMLEKNQENFSPDF